VVITVAYTKEQTEILNTYARKIGYLEKEYSHLERELVQARVDGNKPKYYFLLGKIKEVEQERKTCFKIMYDTW
jgi:hypothetical protein